MQFHLDGFRAGDPGLLPNVANAGATTSSVDVLIVGCGPAGLTLATQLCAFADIDTRIFEQKAGPLDKGQADGLACRSMEMFEAFGFAEKVEKEAYWVNETSFWRPGTDGRISRADRIQDVEDDLSECPHTVLNQARVHDLYLDEMKRSARRLVPNYNRRLVELELTDAPEYPVRAVFDRLEPDAQNSRETVWARYVVGCDGARSIVRNALGYKLKGAAARQLWGVMDVLAITDFPDVRLKCAIQAATAGSLLIIPREGGYLVRMYIELDALKDNQRAADREVTPQALIDKARLILDPYRLTVKEVAWWSAYEIGQRICDSFDDVPVDEREHRCPRIFIAGDACHTHSPKAGQGMNVSMADTFNLGWKLASVLRGHAQPHLLHTYSQERQEKARELIDFDKDMARLFSARPPDESEATQFQAYFAKHGRYTVGVETRYAPSLITGGGEYQSLARGLTVGKRFHSAPVVRVADAKPMQLGHVIKADGRWRLIAFAPRDDKGLPGGAIASLCAFLQRDGASPLVGYVSPTPDPDALLDVRAVFQAGHRDLAIESMPSLLLPNKGLHGLIDYEKIFCPDLKNGPDVFDLRGIDRDSGVMVVVRPDQYVAKVLPLDEFEALTAFFARFLVRLRR